VAQVPLVNFPQLPAHLSLEPHARQHSLRGPVRRTALAPNSCQHLLLHAVSKPPRKLGISSRSFDASRATNFRGNRQQRKANFPAKPVARFDFDQTRARLDVRF
jgi:hypothetical protein